jgi:hypothetical protein
LGDSNNDSDDSMLISVVYVFEDKKRVLVTPICSFVRLEALDHCDILRVNTLEGFLGFSSIQLRLITDGKFNVMASSVIRRELAQWINNKVKGSPSIIGEISYDEAKLIGDGLVQLSDDEKVWRFWISLNKKGIGLKFDEVNDGTFEAVEVFLCSAKLQSWIIEHMLYYHYGCEALASC